MTPAAGQGALVLQARSDDADAIGAAAAIGDQTALRELTAERAVVALLDATCATPIGIHAQVDGTRLTTEAFVGLSDGSEWIRDRVEGDAEEPVAAGALLAERLLSAGARDVLDRAEEMA
jgi:hydroxymethylbilane synthase